MINITSQHLPAAVPADVAWHAVGAHTSTAMFGTAVFATAVTRTVDPATATTAAAGKRSAYLVPSEASSPPV